MSDPSSSSQSVGLPIKKRDITETMPSYSVDDDILFSPMEKKEKLSSFQKKAYSNVLHAFSAESPAISSPRIMIVKELKEEFNIKHKTHNGFQDAIKADPKEESNIKHKTHNGFQDAIKADPIVQQLRNVSLASDEKEMQKVSAPKDRKITGVDGQPLKIRMKPNKDDLLKIRDRILAPAKIKDGKVIAPTKIQDEEANPSSTSDDSPVPSWGQVSPGSLVGRWINIRMPGEHEYIEFLIKEYDEKTETHHLVNAFSKKDFEDPCNWIDIRYIPAEDIEWQEGHPGLPKRKCFLKPGETLLHETSTARNKKQLREVGKTSRGIPIIRKVDKGKSIVGA